MNRRDFVRLTGSGVTAGTLAETLVAAQVAAQPSRPPAAALSKARMKAGTQHGDSDPILRVLAGFGVNHICSRLPSPKLDEAWSVEGLTRLRERVESFGLTLDMVPLPLSSTEISRSESPAIMLGKEPEREQQLDGICQMIRNTSRAGIPSVKYNLTFIGVPRTAPTPGRGGARYSTFVYDGAKQDPPLTVAGPVDADLYWERITYFLERVVPVAAEHKVRLACHPQDPGMPRGKGWRGIETVLGSVDGLKRFVSIAESPYHGLNFCQGTVSEMLEKPGEQIFDVIRHFGQRKKIFNVHFRNISGGFTNFRETFIDDGDVDMLKAMRVYKEIGYDGMMMPDHVPTIEGDAGNLQGFAFAFGYIKALIAAVAAET
jgi:mannonate dehydratase